jgi:histidine triad (HIT) family protein
MCLFYRRRTFVLAAWCNKDAMACKFCEIAEAMPGDETVWEEEAWLAFLDHRPLFPGHVLLIPKQHYGTLGDLPAALLATLFAGAQLLARAVEAGMEAEGSFVAINNRVSQSVPHLHVHIVPRRRKDGLRGFFWPRQSYRDAAHAAEVREALRAAIRRLLGR